MFSIDWRLAFGLVWILACTGATFFLLKRPLRTLPTLPVILLVALFARLIPAIVLPRGASYEMHVFQQTAAAFRTGENIYQGQFAYPYFPLQIYWFAAAHWLAEMVGLFFIFWLKSINILADTLIVGVVYTAVRHLRGPAEARPAGWIYALNPVTILVVAYQGQFDAMPMLFLLLSWYFFIWLKARSGQPMLSAFMLGLAILSKTWPFIFLPMVWFRLPNWRQRVTYTALTTTIVLAGMLVFEFLFPGSLAPMWQRVARAGAVSGWWGYSAVVNGWLQITGQGGGLFAWISRYGKFLGYAAGFTMIVWTRKRPLLYSLLLTILIMFATVPNLGLQGLSWIIAPAVIIGMYNSLGWFIVGATLHMLISYWGIHLARGFDFFLTSEHANLFVQLSSLFVWGVIVMWCVQEIWQKSLFPRLFSDALVEPSHRPVGQL